MDTRIFESVYFMKIIYTSPLFLVYKNMYSLYSNPESLSARDKLFAEERANARLHWGYVPLKRFAFKEMEVDESQRARWILKDRQHFAKWKLDRTRHADKIRSDTEKRRRDNKLEYLSHSINIECEKLNREFWAEAPIMLPHQRPVWEQGRWPEYFWSRTALKREIGELESEELLWLQLPIMF